MLLALFDWPFVKLLSSMSYDDAAFLYCHVSHWRSDPTMVARILSILTIVFAPVGAAVFAALSVTRWQVRSGALAATVTALIAYLALHFWVASLCKWESYIPRFGGLSITLLVFSMLGAGSAWLALKCRPNKSLERTREG